MRRSLPVADPHGPRTALQKHRGITYFIMDMHAPGVEVRPIRQANGRSEGEFGELFLTDVRIPAENMIGAREQRLADRASDHLGSERGVIAFEER